MSTDRPIVFLAFADARADLSSIKTEGWSLRDQFDVLKDRGVIADVVVEEKASLERIYAVFQKHRDRIAIFHFGGHAQGDRLLLESAFAPRAAFADGIATLLGQQRGLKLVFLNGCSTLPHVKRLLDTGVPAVIATARDIEDRLATEFAVAFYQALTTGQESGDRTIPAGCNIDRAFGQASGFARASSRGKLRDLVADVPVSREISDNEGFPWKIQYRPGSEHVGRFSLFEDDPLFALPDVPGGIGWPVEPYRDLAYFRREDARIFFGRGRAIREMYDLLVRPVGLAGSRLIFYYGQTGVGKTSVLAAGLLPRLETQFHTIYARRTAQEGLLGTLRIALAAGGDDTFDLGAAWLAVERQAGRPLLIVLDQAEEAYTRPRAGSLPRQEVHQLFEAVREATAPTRPDRPSGRLILGFRKEWLAEFDEIRKASMLDMKPMMLDPLGHRGVIDAIEGPADHYGLAISPGLAEFISNHTFDTLADPQSEQESPIAPTLQIMLARMWKEAKDPRRSGGQPAFDRALFQELKAKGFKLNEVIQEQFERIAGIETLRDSVKNGLLLDLLEFFTTHEGTANTRTRQQIHERYPDQPADRLDALLEECKTSYLLADVRMGSDGSKAYRLTHDTLAPLIRERFRVSPDPAQRARHALEGRAATWKGRPADPVLERVDLMAVEKGLPWMRRAEKDEPALLEASRQAEARRTAEEAKRQRQLVSARRRVLQVTVSGLGVSLAMLFVAGLYWYRAEGSAALARAASSLADSRRLAAMADLERPERLDLAMLLALEAIKSKVTTEARLSLQRSLAERPEVVRFLRTPGGNVQSVAFGEGGILTAAYNTARERGRIVIFDSQGNPVADTPLGVDHDEVTSVAFGPQQAIAAGYGSGEGGGVVLFHAKDLQLLLDGPLKVEYGRVTSVAVDARGNVAAGYSQGGFKPGGVVVFDPDGKPIRSRPWEPIEYKHTYEVTSVAFDSRGQLFAGFGRESGDHGDYGGVMIFDPRNDTLPPRLLELLEKHHGYVDSIAINAEGVIAAGYREAAFGGVVLFKPDGTRLEPTLRDSRPDGGFSANIKGVAFGSNGVIAAGYGRSKYAAGREGVFLFYAEERRETEKSPLVIREGYLTSVASGPGNLIAVGYAGRADGYSDHGGVILLDTTKPDRFRTASPDVDDNDALTRKLRVDYGDANTDVITAYDPQGKPHRIESKMNVSYFLQSATVVFGPGGQIAVGCFEEEPTDATKVGVELFNAGGNQGRYAFMEVNEGEVRAIAFGPDGQLAVGYRDPSVGNGGGIVLFSAEGKRIRPAGLKDSPEGGVMKVREGGVTSLAFGPGGKLAAGYAVEESVNTGDRYIEGGGVVLFDASGERYFAGSLNVPEGAADRVAFGPNGTIAVHAVLPSRGEGSIIYFDVDPASWQRKAGQIANRNFTRGEWSRYFPESLYRRTIRSLPWPHDLPEAERKRAEAFEKEHPEGSDSN